MASDIRIETGFLDHPKTKMVRRRIGQCAAEYIMRLWFFAADQKPDGDLAGVSDEMIELSVDWQGEPGALVAALAEVRYLDGEENSRRLHQWAEHQPWVCNRGERIESARNAARSRWDKVKNRPVKTADFTGSDAGRMRGACEPHADSNAPNPTQPNPTHTQPKAKPARAALALPVWLPVDQWGAFIDMRKRIKAPLTDRAITLAIAELEKLRAQGQDVGQVLDQSTLNSWKGLFPIKVNGQHRGPPGAAKDFLGDNNADLLSRMQQRTEG